MNLKPGREIALLGLGNLLLKDDGIGIWLIRRLRQTRLFPDVKIYEIGTAIFAIDSLVRECSRLLLVDAVHGGEKPGTVYNLSPDEIRPPHRRHAGGKFTLLHSLHELLIPELLAAPETAVPDWWVFGVEPAEIDCGIGLSAHLREKLLSIEAALVATVREMASSRKGY